MDGVILVNKQTGITSHTLVAKIRRILNIDKVGHTGTLDPLASGLMIVTVGKATKLLTFLNYQYKEYICTMKLGYDTDTLDITGETLNKKSIIPYTKEDYISTLNSFIGKQKQIPPMYSAKKINGRHLYDIARKDNIVIERSAIDIDIKELELLNVKEDSFTFRALVSTGTYIRTLGCDIANKMNNYACMQALQRTKIGPFSLQQSCSLKQLEKNEFSFISPYQLLSDYTYIEYDNINDVLNGKRIKLNSTEELVMIVKDKTVYAAYQNDHDGYFSCRRGLF